MFVFAGRQADQDRPSSFERHRKHSLRTSAYNPESRVDAWSEIVKQIIRRARSNGFIVKFDDVSIADLRCGVSRYRTLAVWSGKSANETSPLSTERSVFEIFPFI